MINVDFILKVETDLSRLPSDTENALLFHACILLCDIEAVASWYGVIFLLIFFSRQVFTPENHTRVEYREVILISVLFYSVKRPCIKLRRINDRRYYHKTLTLHSITKDKVALIRGGSKLLSVNAPLNWFKSYPSGRRAMVTIFYAQIVAMVSQMLLNSVRNFISGQE